MIGREEIVALETLARQQVRIYPDACDTGVWETPAVRATIRRTLASLANLEGMEVRDYTRGVSVTTRLAIEEDGALVAGYVVRVDKIQAKGNGAARCFYSIDIRRAEWSAGASLAQTTPTRFYGDEQWNEQDEVGLMDDEELSARGYRW